MVDRGNNRSSRTYVYAISGEEEKSVEKYDIALKKWSHIAELPQWRSCHSSVVLCNTLTAVSEAILVIGGNRNGKGSSSLVEQYNLKCGKWIIASWRLPEPRTQFSAHLLSNGDLLLYGGYNNKGSISSCSCVNLNQQIDGSVVERWRYDNIRSYYDASIACNGIATC